MDKVVFFFLQILSEQKSEVFLSGRIRTLFFFHWERIRILPRGSNPDLVNIGPEPKL